MLGQLPFEALQRRGAARGRAASVLLTAPMIDSVVSRTTGGVSVLEGCSIRADGEHSHTGSPSR
jgi:hypothetical protein